LPDLNVIENIWLILKQWFKKQLFLNEELLKKGILEEWAKIGQDQINKLC
jgi:transposase